MFDESKDLVEARTITMYPSHWATVESFSKDNGYNVSAGLRRIVDEWLELKKAALDREAALNDLQARFAELLAAASQALDADQDNGYDARAYLEATVHRVAHSRRPAPVIRQGLA